MPKQENFVPIFDRLKPILQVYESKLVVKADAPGNYSLDTPYLDKYRKAVMFGAVQIRKNYVSFHLMPLYIFPDLLNDLSPTLKKRMQGKSCFNFKSVDEILFHELDALVHRSVERVHAEKMM